MHMKSNLRRSGSICNRSARLFGLGIDFSRRWQVDGWWSSKSLPIFRSLQRIHFQVNVCQLSFSHCIDDINHPSPFLCDDRTPINSANILSSWTAQTINRQYDQIHPNCKARWYAIHGAWIEKSWQEVIGLMLCASVDDQQVRQSLELNSTNVYWLANRPRTPFPRSSHRSRWSCADWIETPNHKPALRAAHIPFSMLIFL